MRLAGNNRRAPNTGSAMAARASANVSKRPQTGPMHALQCNRGELDAEMLRRALRLVGWTSPPAEARGERGVRRVARQPA